MWLCSFASSSYAQNYGVCYAAHSQGNIQLEVDGCSGGWGTMRYHNDDLLPLIDPVTGDEVFACVYPRDSRNIFMWGDLFMGAIAGRDTLHTTFGWRGQYTYGSHDWEGLWKIMSSSPDNQYYSAEARSDLDLECQILDTPSVYGVITTPPWGPVGGAPMGLTVTRRSMAWSASQVDDFVLLQYDVLNSGEHLLNDLYVTFYCAPFRLAMSNIALQPDDLTGFLRGAHIAQYCDQFDSMNIAYFMDNDGDPVDGEFNAHSRRGAVGLMLLGASQEVKEIGYNWVFWDPAWTNDWGPRRQPSEEEPFRRFDPYFAWPGSENNVYYMASNPHIAYDQIMADIPHTQEGWMPPTSWAKTVANGYPCYVFYSFGPFQLGRNERLNFTIAIVGGDNVHHDPRAVFQPEFPQPFYDQLDFSELIENARWAKKVYDTPGFDTDGDGYRGEFHLCEGDTVWYKGDGVPDFKADSPPPAPFTRYMTEEGKITVRWNGYLSETTVDRFSGLVDFEGYKVYAGLDDRRGSLSLLSTYDRLDFRRFYFRQLDEANGKWESDEPPFSLDSLRVIYGDPDFDPLRYDRIRPLIYNDTAYYFERVLDNQFDLSNPSEIHKVYPNATDPGTDSTLWTEEDITMEHGRRLPKYYEYEFVYEGILPTVAYFMSVTALDYGFTGGRSTMPPQESNPLNNLTEVYALPSADAVEEQNLDVVVYPNPYRVDADYAERGFENRKGVIIPDRARLIHFANLPNVCKISIFSLDGDLIGTIDHNYPEGGPEAMHDWWNLVSRSGLAVTSGLYYWVVESETRSQIGKLVILK